MTVEELAARGLRVKTLAWHRSAFPHWNDDWHTVPTGYTVRCADEWGWKWSLPIGVFGYEPSPSAAKAAAEADHAARIAAQIEQEGEDTLALQEANRAAHERGKG